MGSVIDFVRRVVGRSDRRLPNEDRRHGSGPAAIFDEPAFAEALARLDQASPSSVIDLGPTLASACLWYGHFRHGVASAAMQAHPDAAWILAFDGDGYIREAALQRLAEPASSAARVATIAARLNDWVPEVRAAAISAADRVWPATPAHVIAEAAPYLFRQRFLWSRWGEQGRAALDQALGREDVAARLSATFMSGRTGPLGSVLRNASRFPSYDGQLLGLASEAKLATVRAAALKMLLDGRATWTVGHDWEWIDKVYGVRRRVPRLEHRRVHAPDAGALIRKCLGDPSALVRRIAASGLIEHAAEMRDAPELARGLMRDRSRAVRERADFVLRHPSAKG